MELKTPDQIEREIVQYQRDRFEAYMRMVDDGVLTRALSISALRDEMESGIWTAEQDQSDMATGEN